jgi:hypothetical protein
MLILISPAKKLDFDTAPITDRFTQCDFLGDAQTLINTAKQLSKDEIAKLMHLSDKLAQLNVDRYQSWRQPFTPQNAKPALLAFKGDVYAGMNADTFTEANLDFAQQHLRMLSGLYGLLRPLDLIQPYRLEMGTRLANPRGKNLYEFWGMQITTAVNKAVVPSGSDTLINLASNEYFKSVKTQQTNGQLITPQFKEYKDGAYKIIGIYAKRARGLMSRYIIENELIDAQDIKAFDWEGYAYNPELSTEHHWVFTRNNS